MSVVNVHQAKSTLSHLLTLAERGEEVVIARNGVPVARLVACQESAKPQPGAWRALPGWENFEYDPAVFAPMSDAELAEAGWPV